MTRYGIDVVWKVAAILVLITAISWLAATNATVRATVSIISGLLMLFTLYFFRDPERKTPGGDDLIVSPADGKVVLIKEVHEDEYLHQDATQISIFLSPFDVHVNRFPVSGKVEYFRYIPGKYIVAFDEKASVANERTHIGIANLKAKILFKQIAGFIARRIVADVRVGTDAIAGTRFGMIKFGSRVDLCVPKSTEVRVTVGQRVVAGETVMAVFR
jgi:phosphatidylserine decarboxylase